VGKGKYDKRLLATLQSYWWLSDLLFGHNFHAAKIKLVLAAPHHRISSYAIMKRKAIAAIPVGCRAWP
jgi:hypothetical protein